MRPVIFLDIDGVLVTERSMRSGDRRAFDAEAVAALRKLAAESRAEIVVSSTWRYGFSLTALRQYLRQRGLTGVRIIDKTPDLSEPVGSCSLVAAPTRGREIAEWLRLREHPGPFVILDDDDDMEDLLPRLVQTDFSVGLTAAQAQEAARLLASPRTS